MYLLVKKRGYARHSQDAVKSEEHVKRKNEEYRNKNIDKTRIKDNVSLIENDNRNCMEIVENIIYDYDLKVQKNQNVLIEFIITMHFTDSENESIKNFSKNDYVKLYEFIKEELEKKYKDSVFINFELHFDEIKPHAHVFFVPIIQYEKDIFEEISYEEKVKKASAKALEKAKEFIKKSDNFFDETKALLPKSNKEIKKFLNDEDCNLDLSNGEFLYLMETLKDEYEKRFLVSMRNKNFGAKIRKKGEYRLSKNETLVDGKKEKEAFKLFQDDMFEISQKIIEKINRENNVNFFAERKRNTNKEYIDDIEQFKSVKKSRNLAIENKNLKENLVENLKKNNQTEILNLFDEIIKSRNSQISENRLLISENNKLKLESENNKFINTKIVMR